jgi:hypothetical protein
VTGILSVDAVVDDLLNGLRARTALQEIQISDGWPGGDQKRKSIWVDEINSSDIEPRMTGGAPTRHSEVYDIVILIDVLAQGRGSDSRKARQEVTTLMNEVLAYVSENKRPLGSSSIRTRRWQIRPYTSKEGRGSAARITLSVTARR